VPAYPDCPGKEGVKSVSVYLYMTSQCMCNGLTMQDVLSTSASLQVT